MADDTKKTTKDLKSAKSSVNSILDTMRQVGKSFGDTTKSSGDFNDNLGKTKRSMDAVHSSTQKTNRAMEKFTKNQEQALKNAEKQNQQQEYLARTLNASSTLRDKVHMHKDTYSNTRGTPIMAKSVTDRFNRSERSKGLVGGVSRSTGNLSVGIQSLGDGLKVLASGFAPLKAALSTVGGLLGWLMFLFIGTAEKAKESARAFGKATFSMGEFGNSIDVLSSSTVSSALRGKLTDAAKLYGYASEDLFNAVGEFSSSGGIIPLTEEKIGALGESIAKLARITGQEVSSVSQFLGGMENLMGRSVDSSTKMYETITKNFFGSGLRIEDFNSTVKDSLSSMGDFGMQIKGNARYLASLKNITVSNTRALELFQSAQAQKDRDIGETKTLASGFLASDQGREMLEKQGIATNLAITKMYEKLKTTGKGDEARKLKMELTTLLDKQDAIAGLLKNPSNLGALHVYQKGGGESNATLHQGVLAGLMERLTVGKTINPATFMAESSLAIAKFAEKFSVREEELRHLLRNFVLSDKINRKEAVTQENVFDFMSKRIKDMNKFPEAPKDMENRAKGFGKMAESFSTKMKSFTDGLMTIAAKELGSEIDFSSEMADKALSQGQKFFVSMLGSVISIKKIITNISKMMGDSWLFTSPPKDIKGSEVSLIDIMKSQAMQPFNVLFGDEKLGEPAWLTLFFKKLDHYMGKKPGDVNTHFKIDMSSFWQAISKSSSMDK